MQYLTSLAKVRSAIEHYLNGVTSEELKAQLLEALSEAIALIRIQDTESLEDSNVENLFIAMSKTKTALGGDEDTKRLYNQLRTIVVEINRIIHLQAAPLERAQLLPKSSLWIPPNPASLSIIVDSDVDQEAFAEFLGELSAIYSNLSDGDELIIVEGKLPVGEGVFA